MILIRNFLSVPEQERLLNNEKGVKAKHAPQAAQPEMNLLRDVNPGFFLVRMGSDFIIFLLNGKISEH